MTSGRPLAALLPHAGAMCLLDELLSWDTTRVAPAGDPRKCRAACTGGSGPVMRRLKPSAAEMGKKSREEPAV